MDKEQAKKLAKKAITPPALTKMQEMMRLAKQQELDAAMKKAAKRPAKYPDDAKAQSKKKPSSYAKGGKVRGCGIARKGLTKGAMR